LTAPPSMDMTIRRPRFDFEHAETIWTPAHPEFGYTFNGGSLVLPYLEPYLIRVMRQARKQLVDLRPDLVADIDLFNGQEANHYKIHGDYNAVLRERYSGLEAFEAEAQADFARMLGEESLEFNLGYAAGFETTGLLMAEMFFDGCVDSLAGADPASAGLWGWHLAEEFEHRNVAHDVLKALYPGWLHRLGGLRYCGRHLFRFTSRVCEHMLAIDRERGRLCDDAALRRAARAFQWRRQRFQLPRFAKIFMPWYSPHPRRMQAPTRQVLAAYDS
jgi:predicted metal-dependent hydrolase